MQRLLRIAVSAAIAGSSLVLAVGDGPAAAAPLPTAYSASAGAELLRVNALSRFGGAPSAYADIGVTESLSTVNSTATPRSTATASNITLGAPIAGLAVSRLQQTAPPNHPAASSQLVAVDNPVLGVKAVGTSVHARWDGDKTCPPAGTPLATTTDETAGAAVGIPGGLPPGDAPAAANPAGTAKPARSFFPPRTAKAARAAAAPAATGVNFPLLVTGAGSTGGATSLVSVPGPRDSRAVQATATASLRTVDLGGGFIQIAIAGSPSLVATATGNPATSTLAYLAPTVSVVVNGTPTPIPPSGILVIDAGQETITLALGRLTNAVNTGNVVSGQASVFTLTLAGLINGSLVVGPLAVRAEIPSTGIQCIAPVVAPTSTPATTAPPTRPTTPPVTPTPGPQLAATGTSRTAPLSLLGFGLIVAGAGALFATRRRPAAHR